MNDNRNLILLTIALVAVSVMIQYFTYNYPASDNLVIGWFYFFGTFGLFLGFCVVFTGVIKNLIGRVKR